MGKNYGWAVKNSLDQCVLKHSKVLKKIVVRHNVINPFTIGGGCFSRMIPKTKKANNKG